MPIRVDWLHWLIGWAYFPADLPFGCSNNLARIGVSYLDPVDDRVLLPGLDLSHFGTINCRFDCVVDWNELSTQRVVRVTKGSILYRKDLIKVLFVFNFLKNKRHFGSRRMVKTLENEYSVYEGKRCWND